jgi:predicted DNA-binding transcriptional regulator AlpA
MTSTIQSDTGSEPRPESDEIFWTLKTVRQKTGLSSATIYRYMAVNLFPARRKLGPNRVGWLASEVKTWGENRPELRR